MSMAYGASEAPSNGGATGGPASYQASDTDTGIGIDHNDTPTTFSTRLRTMALGAMALAGAALASGRVQVPVGGISLAASPPLASPPVAIGNTNAHMLHISNAIERDQGYEIGQGYLPWDKLAEVYEKTLLAVIDPKEDLTYTWKMTTKGEYGEYVSGAGGTEVMFKEPGWHTVTVEASDGTSSTFEVMAKYVRRELRNMTSFKLEKFFDTLQTVYSTSQADGEKMYGPKYRSIERLVAEHLRGAADKECDHWHDEAGVITHHVAYTLEMEQSLQSVDPSMTVPYWDYTIDAYMYGSDVMEKSPIFNDDWFGIANPNNTDHIVDTGRWAYTKISVGAKDDSPRNPYGLLRSPWNTNPHPYLLRSSYVGGEKHGGWTMPGCSDYETAWEADHLAEYFKDLNGYLHGPVHIMIGGQWWDNPDFAMNHTYGGEMLLASKWLWRQGYIRCPEACSADMPSQDCVCSIPSELQKEWADDSWPSGIDQRRFLKNTGLFNVSHEIFQNYDDDSSYMRGDFGCSDTSDTRHVVANLTEMECYEQVVKSLGHVGHAGEMFTSAAPWDPTFWPIHGFADRYLALKRLKADKGDTTLILKWAYSHLTDDGTGESPSDVRHVCDWSDVESGSMQMPTCVVGTCAGHHADDILPMGNFLSLGETYTNMEFLNFTSPTNDDLTYTYNSFDYYPACTTQNMEFWKKSW